MSTRKKKRAPRAAKKKAKTTSRKKRAKTAPRKAARKAAPKKKAAPRRKAAPKKKAAPRKKAAKKSAAPRTQKILAAAFSGDGRVLATSVGKRVLLWDVSTPAKPKQLGSAQTQAEASRLSLDATGSRIAAGIAGFSEVRIRSSNGALLHEVRARGPVTCFAFAPDGRFVVGEVERIGEDGLHARSFVTLYDLAGTSAVELFRAPVVDLPIREVAFSKDGLLMFLGFGGGLVIVFDVEEKRELFRFPQLDPSEIGARIAASFAFSSDGRRAAISWEDIVEVWPIEGGNRVARVALGTRTWSVALSHDGERVICGAPASTVVGLDGQAIGSIPLGHHVVASPTGSLVMTSEKLDPSRGPELLALPA